MVDRCARIYFADDESVRKGGVSVCVWDRVVRSVINLDACLIILLCTGVIVLRVFNLLVMHLRSWVVFARL